MITVRRMAKAMSKHASRLAIKLRRGLGARPRHYCPACERGVVGFYRYGAVGQWGCPECDSSPRERLVNVLLTEGILTIPARAAVLHMAPNETSLVRRFSAAADRYRPADISPERYRATATQPIDLMTLAETATLDIVYASHVMEHVPDDARVLANIHRALKPGGEAWLLVPLHHAPTEDGEASMSPGERERRFGQWDHVRQYGPDFADRIAAAGFIVETMGANDCPPNDAKRSALGESVFRAIKRADP